MSGARVWRSGGLAAGPPGATAERAKLQLRLSGAEKAHPIPATRQHTRHVHRPPCGEVDGRGRGQAQDERLGFGARDERVELRLLRPPREGNDAAELVDVVVPWKQGPPLQELGEDAPNGPHVDGRRVLLARQHDLGGAVPPRHHVLRQLLVAPPAQVRVLGSDAAGEPEVWRAEGGRAGRAGRAGV